MVGPWTSTENPEDDHVGGKSITSILSALNLSHDVHEEMLSSSRVHRSCWRGRRIREFVLGRMAGGVVAEGAGGMRSSESSSDETRRVLGDESERKPTAGGQTVPEVKGIEGGGATVSVPV